MCLHVYVAYQWHVQVDHIHLHYYSSFTNEEFSKTSQKNHNILNYVMKKNILKDKLM